MNGVTLPALSTEYVKVDHVRLIANGQVVDPTGLAVELALVSTSTEPTVLDWAAGSWETAAGRYLARVLVGPDGALNPGAGVWMLWMRLHASPQTVVRPEGIVVITSADAFVADAEDLLVIDGGTP